MDADEKIFLAVTFFSPVINCCSYDVQMKYDTWDNEGRSNREQAEL